MLVKLIPQKESYMKHQLFLRTIFAQILILSCIVFPMDPDCSDVVCIRVKDGVCPVKKDLIPLIGGLAAYHYKHGNDIARNRRVPAFNVEKKRLDLVCSALHERPDTFCTFYDALPSENQKLLIEQSGFCEQKNDKKNIMLHVSEIGKRIIEFDKQRFPEDIRKLIKFYAGSKDEDFVRAYCKARLLSANPLGLNKVPYVDFLTYSGNNFPSAIEWDSLFLNGHFVHNQPFSQIPLHVGHDVYPTFKYNFVTDNYEFRITATHTSRFSQTAPLAKQCYLWVINHDNSALNCSAKIIHASTIIGCWFSKTGTDTEYVVTYSKRDLVFSKVTKAVDGSSSVESIQAFTPDNGIIACACFNHLRNELHVMTHEAPTEDKEPHCGWRNWGMNGVCSPPARINTKDYGQVQNVFVTKDAAGSDMFVIACAAGRYYGFLKYNRLENAPFNYYGMQNKQYSSLSEHNGSGRLHPGIELKNNSAMLYDFSCSPFTAKQKLKAQNAQDGWLKSWTNSFCFEPDQQKIWTYSPDGALLMSNALTMKGGSAYIVTHLQDARSRQHIAQFSTLERNCEGIGFNDSGELVFLNAKICNEKVPLRLTDEAKKTVQDFENLACSNSAVASVMARLCQECQKNGYIALSKLDPLRQMLVEWSKNSEGMKKLLEVCLPLHVKK
jgi:hypothetical protein